MHNRTLILIQCRDTIGLVALIAQTVAKHELNIVTMREFVDEKANLFFVRVVCSGQAKDKSALEADLQNKLPAHANIQVNSPEPKKLVLLVTKEHHCLADILIRHHFQTLGAEVQAVIGNYEALGTFTQKFNIPYIYISHEHKTKELYEQELIHVIQQYPADYVVLAKFMRILSPNFVQTFQGKIINIHHSFLPAFIGANPYKQAHDRGVKIIGATAHYVTDDLDEGPIIVQETKRVNHNFTVKDMVIAGQEIEKAVLAKAIKLIIEDRVIINGNKTIVFE